jgi:ADP-ribose pyrophosphatase YjhB (NUDIX family)
LFPGPTASSFAAASPESKVWAIPAGTVNAAVAAAESFKNDLREIFIESP